MGVRHAPRHIWVCSTSPDSHMCLCAATPPTIIGVCGHRMCAVVESVTSLRGDAPATPLGCWWAAFL